MINRKSMKWKPIYLVLIYRMMRNGIPEKDQAKALGVTRERIYRWMNELPELKEAVEMARRERAENESMPDWVYAHLSPELQEIWKKIEKWHEMPDGVAKIELMLQDEGKRVRQQLFLYALCVSNFCPSAALRMVNVSRKTLNFWISSDGEFAELVDEVQWHKGNFFEESLVRLVREGNPAAVLFANKTFNKERGYQATAKLEVEHSGAVLHGVVDLAELMDYLSQPCRLELLEALRQKNAKDTPALTVQERLSQEIANVGSQG
jgi:hypothetical protein